MYAEQAYLKQRQENLVPGRSPPCSDDDVTSRRNWDSAVTGRAMFESRPLYPNSHHASAELYSQRQLSDNLEMFQWNSRRATASHDNCGISLSDNSDVIMNSRLCHPSRLSEAIKLSRKKRRARTFILLAGVFFVGLLLLDGVVQLTSSSHQMVESHDEHFSTTTLSNDRLLLDGQTQIQMNEHTYDEIPNNGEMKRTHYSVRALLSDSEVAISQDKPSHAAPSLHKKQRLLHRLPLLPKYALQNRQRRELIRDKKPLPLHLRLDGEEEMYHAAPHQRRRMYPMVSTHDATSAGQMVVVDARRVHRRTADADEAEPEDDMDEATFYETGAVYQGYGTHYLDLWVGTPPQRQTVIIDTGSSITAFPCSGCDNCGSDPSTGLLFHLDPDFDKSKSATYEEGTCQTGVENVKSTFCPLGACVHRDEMDLTSPQTCRLAAAYAEGSSWTALEGSDVVYPFGPHEEGLVDSESRIESGVGVGMGDLNAKTPFDWMDFRLMFGCQMKVTGLFRTQLEDGIMGMDNRPGSFWLQLRDHYTKNGYMQDKDDDAFDPSQFSLCYDRQPITSELESGVGSGSLTLGGSDPLLHGTPMVYANNITPKEGWYTVYIKGIFLRTKGGSLANPFSNSSAIRYVRVDADEKLLNGDNREGHGPIIDSGTTDTFLSVLLKPAFQEAWKEALQNTGAEFDNSPINMTPEQIKILPTVLVVLQGHSQSTQPDYSEAVGMAGHPNHSSMFQRSPNEKTSNSISLNDVVVAIPPEHYMEESLKEPGKYIARIYFTEVFGQRAIFGSNFIMGHEVLFDNGAGRIGFAESHCDYSLYVSQRDALLQASIDAGGSDSTEDAILDESQAATLQGDNSLISSGWSRKVQEVKEVRIPG